MNRARATALAIAALEREIKAVVFDANLHDLMGAEYPYAVKASERRKELREAIEALKEPKQTRMKL